MDAEHASATRVGPVAWIARVLLLVFLAGLAVLVLAPSTGGPDQLLSTVADRLVLEGFAPETVNVVRLELIANVLMVIPVGALGALAFPRLRWQDWTAYAFVGALAVEIAQGLLLPERQMSATDVVANTLGAALGALVVVMPRMLFRPRLGG